MKYLDLTKPEAENLLDLRKEMIQTLCLEKPPLNGLTSRVALVLDESCSMYELYRDGIVQSIVDKVFPVAISFDDNEEMEIWTFSESFRRLAPISKKNFYGYVKRNIGLPKGNFTNYAPVIKDIYQKYVIENPEPLPTYVIFITDGDNQDVAETTEIIKAVSKFPIFFQFVGIGQYSFSYLEELDNMTGRYVDNANFCAMNNITNVGTDSDEQIYSLLLKEYPLWIENRKVKKMIEKLHPAQRKTFVSSLFNKFIND